MRNQPASAPDSTPTPNPIAELMRALDVRWRMGLALLLIGLAVKLGLPGLVLK